MSVSRLCYFYIAIDFITYNLYCDTEDWGAWLLSMCNTVQLCVCLCLCVCEFGVFGEGGDVLKIDILQLWASSAELCASHLSLLLGHSGGQCGLEVGMCLN